MSVVNTGGSGPDSSGVPTPVPIVAPNAAIWIIIVGAFFGLITLVGLFAFAYLSSTNPQLCSSFQFQLLAGGFALGAALAGSFIGGGAGAQGKSGSAAFSLVFGLTGGAALLVVTLAVFSFFAPKGCDVLGSEQMQINLEKVRVELASTKASLDQANTDLSTALTQKAAAQQQVSSLRGQLSETQANLKTMNDTHSQTSANLERVRAALASMTTERDAATSANATARAEIKRLVAAIQGVFPDADKLSTSVSTITNLVTQSCSGGAHGEDPAHASEIRTISGDASRRIASAKTALDNIVASVSAELRK